MRGAFAAPRDGDSGTLISLFCAPATQQASLSAGMLSSGQFGAQAAHPKPFPRGKAETCSIDWDQADGIQSATHSAVNCM
jgi:hypothetical protein